MSQPSHSRFHIYLSMEIKKYLLAFPKICGGLCLILLFISSYFLLYQCYSGEQQKQSVIQIGITADPEEPYLDWMIQTIESMKDLERSCHFEFVSETEGMKRLQAGDYTALFLIPPDYIRSLIAGEEAILRIRFCQGQATIADFLVKELGNAASQIMLDTQAGIYAMQDIYRENHWENMSKDELSLNIRYLQKVLNRREIYAYEEIPVTGTTADRTHYFAVAILCFLTALGFTCTAVLHREPHVFVKKLELCGLRDWQQLLAKETAMILCFSGIYLFLSLLLTALSTRISGFHSLLHQNTDSSLHSMLLTGGKLLAIMPVLFVICAYILWIYEICPNNMSSILLLFVSFIGLSYLSGYFYPLSYLPDSIRQISAYLPTSVILNYSYHILCGIGHWRDLLGILAYSMILYATLLCFVRWKRRWSH
ncbi:MAG: ABC transporter permease [Lachnospiraceae bacterium]|nr:ABC transporter permease [Lachnospiraceae bacterium]